MVYEFLYKTINSSVQKKELFCTEEYNLLYKMFWIYKERIYKQNRKDYYLSNKTITFAIADCTKEKDTYEE